MPLMTFLIYEPELNSEKTICIKVRVKLHLFKTNRKKKTFLFHTMEKQIIEGFILPSRPKVLYSLFVLGTGLSETLKEVR